MINDQEFLHGAAFLRLINYGSRITIIQASAIHPSLYILEKDDSKSAVLFKVSKKPKSAWSFTLSSQEESALDTLQSKYRSISIFIALICHKDGVCCITKEQLWSVLNRNTGASGKHISVSRQPHERTEVQPRDEHSNWRKSFGTWCNY